MADPVLPDEMLAGLRDIRLPDTAPGGILAEIAVAIGLGLLLACALSFLIALFTRSTRERLPDLQDQMRQIRTMTEPSRSVALLHLIRTENPEAAEALQGRLYARDRFPTTGELERLAIKPKVNARA